MYTAKKIIIFFKNAAVLLFLLFLVLIDCKQRISLVPLKLYVLETNHGCWLTKGVTKQTYSKYEYAVNILVLKMNLNLKRNDS